MQIHHVHDWWRMPIVLVDGSAVAVYVRTLRWIAAYCGMLRQRTWHSICTSGFAASVVRLQLAPSALSALYSAAAVAMTLLLL